MLFPALLAALTVTVTPPPLAALKVIGSVRSTPICTALRKNIAPAVTALLENDSTIGRSRPVLASMYKEVVINRSDIAWWLHMSRLDYLVRPLVSNLETVDNALNDRAAFTQPPKTADEKLLAQTREKLRAIEAQQQNALNVINGFIETQRMGLFQHDMFDNKNWESVLSVGPPRPESRFSGGLYAAGVSQGLHAPPDPRFDASFNGLGHDPYKVFSDYVLALQSTIATAQDAAASVLTPIVSSCQTRSP